MQPSFAAVRERYLEELIEHEWYDVRTFGKKQRQEMTTPGYLGELLQRGHVTAVEMHSHTPRSDGLIEPERISAWTHALYKKGYFRHAHLTVPLVVMVTDHDYIYRPTDLQAIAYEEGLTFLPSTEVSTEHGHVLYYGSHPEIVHTLELSTPQLSVKPGGPEFFAMVQALEGGVAIPAHPYRETSLLRTLPGDEIAPMLVAVETLNGKTPADQNRAAIDYARQHGLRGVGGSDAHQMSRLYSYLTLFDGPIHSLDDLVIALRQGDYFPVHGEHLRFKEAWKGEDMAPHVDWYYHRKGWTTCAKASGFLEARGIPIRETVPASRKLGRTEALAMARAAHRLVAAKGKKVTTLDLQTAPPTDDVLAGLMLGPTGNLRAPIMRVGQTILVGYNDQAFTGIFGWETACKETIWP